MDRNKDRFADCMAFCPILANGLICDCVGLDMALKYVERLGPPILSKPVLIIFHNIHLINGEHSADSRTWQGHRQFNLEKTCR